MKKRNAAKLKGKLGYCKSIILTKGLKFSEIAEKGKKRL